MALKIFGGSDLSRWSNSGNLLEEWQPRTATLAKWIPKGSRVIEFGAGNRKLQPMLDASCTYFASDLVEKPGVTLVCDLNKKPLPNLSEISPEIAVFSGVLEYIHDLPTLAAWLATHVNKCLVSYSCVDTRGGALRRIRGAYQRANHGWVNNYTEPQIVEIFHEVGFQCTDKDHWKDQRLFLFENQRTKKRYD